MTTVTYTISKSLNGLAIIVSDTIIFSKTQAIKLLIATIYGLIFANLVLYFHLKIKDKERIQMYSSSS